MLGFGKKLPTISLCMIVRNEAENIVHALDSVKKVVDEIIIVDTGSTDNTVAVCRRYTDKIYFFKWQDDFSAARNESIKHASGDWIMILDGDEIMEAASAKLLKRFLRDAPAAKTIFHFLIYDVTKQDILSKIHKRQRIDVYPYKVHQHVRLFRNHLGYKYKYSLHELLDAGDYNIGMYRADLKIFHYGYNSVNINRQERALACLKKDLEKYPNDLFVKFNLARTYYLTDQSDQTVSLMDEVIEKYLKYPELRREIPLALIYKYYVNMLLGLKMYEKALKVTFAWLTRLTDNYDPRPYVALGKAYYMLDRDDEAQKILELAQKSLQKKIVFDYPEEIPYIEKDINYFLGCLYLDRGNPREALKLLTSMKKRFLLNDPKIDRLISIAVAKSK